MPGETVRGVYLKISRMLKYSKYYNIPNIWNIGFSFSSFLLVSRWYFQEKYLGCITWPVYVCLDRLSTLTFISFYGYFWSFKILYQRFADPLLYINLHSILYGTILFQQQLFILTQRYWSGLFTIQIYLLCVYKY